MDAGLQQYEAATLDGLCLQIRETLLKFGWITPSDGVKVDSYYGVATDIWHRVLSIGGHSEARGEAPHHAEC